MAVLQATVPVLAARALRKLGVAIVAAVNLPANVGTASQASIVQQALRELGVNVVASEPLPPTANTITQAELAAQALRAVGISPIAQSDVIEPVLTTYGQAYLAQNALKLLGVNLVEQQANPGADGSLFTVANIGNMALVQLGIIASDQTASSQDTALATQYAGAFQAEMVQLNYVRWTASTIPMLAANLYMIAVAALLGPAFEKPFQAAEYAGAVAQIKQLAIANSSAQQFAYDNIGLVHQTLLGKNMVSWDLNSIPDPVAQYYILLAAQNMATTFGQTFDPAAYNGAMAGIRRYCLSGAYGQAIAEEKIQQVHEVLNSRNINAWTISTVPEAAAEAYVAMAAFLLEPEVQKAPDQPQQYTQEAFDAAIQRVRLIVLSGAYATAIANAELVNIHDALNGASIVSWNLLNIPASVADSYTTLLAENLAPVYGRPSDAKAAAAAMDQVRQVSMIMGSQALGEQVLRGLHAEWRSREMIRWEIMDIPREAEEPYVEATACRLGPQFPGGPYDKNWELQAEMALNRIVTMRSSRQPTRSEWF